MNDSNLAMMTDSAVALETQIAFQNFDFYYGK